MRLKDSIQRLSPSRRQQGMVLIVGLVMVLLLTIIGLAAIRGSGMQERMAFNTRDKTVALLAAEAGLRACETKALKYNADTPTPCTAGSGICGNLTGQITSPSNGLVAWQALAAPITELAPIAGLAAQPQCLIEVIPLSIFFCSRQDGSSMEVSAATGNCATIRVTVVATGGEATTRVVLQSTSQQVRSL